MAKKSIQVLNNEIRMKYLAMFEEFLTEKGEEVLRVPVSENSKSRNYNLAMPVCDEEGNEKAIIIGFTVPTGSRKTDEAYDVYEANQTYLANVKEQDDKDKAKAEKKEREAAERKRKAEAKKTVKTMKKDIEEIFGDKTEATEEEWCNWKGGNALPLL